VKTLLNSLLSDSIELLKEVQVAPRTSKGLATKIEEFITQTQETLQNPPDAGPRMVTWRLAFITNKKTGRPYVALVNKDGSLPPTTAEAVGMTHVHEWHEVSAPSQAIARELIDEGKSEVKIRKG